MFDKFFKPKYYTKCKSCVKLLKMRLDAIRKRKSVIVKNSKSDIVELLESCRDYNAYNRAEWFFVERNLLRCYELIEEFCGTINNQLSLLNKQSECPEECKEAVASLIYAAARFADLPELRELRNLFTRKYGSSFEPFINNELIEKSRKMALSKEMKLQLLQEIAHESAIDWNSKALEQQLFTPPQIEPVGDRMSTEKRKKTKVASVAVHKRKSSSQLGEEDISDNDSIFDSQSDGNTTESSTGDSSNDQDVQKGVSEDELEDRKPFYLGAIQPPYLKTKPTNRESREVTDQVENNESNKQQQLKSTLEEKPKPKSVRRRGVKPQPARDINVDDVGNSANDGAEMVSSSRNKGKETMKEEEMDGLLWHYGKKKTSHESNKAKGNLKSQRQEEKHNVEPQKLKNTKTENAFPKTRSVSLPIDSTEPTEPVKKHTKTNSFVHPKLPDYDQLAALFAALKEEK